MSKESTDLVEYSHSTSILTQGHEATSPATSAYELEFLKAEHEQRMEYARIEHERRMQVIEAEAALVDEKRRRLVGVIAPSNSRPGALAANFSGPASLETIREVLTYHLGTPGAADDWLNSPDTGYPTTAMDAIRDGKAELVMADLEQQWGPSPSYA